MNPDLLVKATTVVTIPYNFEVIDFSGGSGGPHLDLNLFTTPIISQIGSIAVTLWQLLINANVLFIFMGILAAILILWWLWSTVTGKPSTVPINVFGAIDVGADLAHVHNARDAFQLEADYEDMIAAGQSPHQIEAAVRPRIEAQNRRGVNINTFRNGAKVFKRASRRRF